MSETCTVVTPTGREITVPTGLLIDGGFRPAQANNKLDVYNPATGSVIASISGGDQADVDAAVKAARNAFDNAWGKHTTPDQRAALLNKWADLIEAHTDELAELESLNNGKPVWISKSMDIATSVKTLRYYAGLADKLNGRTIELAEGKRLAFTRLVPYGVCGQIIPWNYPIMMFAWKVAPALAAGNTIVMKPAEITPLTAQKLAELSIEAGFPSGVVNVVNGLGSKVGKAISEHKGINKVAFTGSTATGRTIASAASASNLKKVSLELGGKSPMIVFEDADLEQSAKWIAMGFLFNMGQNCTAGTRVFVHKSIKDKFLNLLLDTMKQHKVGDPFDPSTFQGPQVSESQYKRILSYIQSGKEQGAKVLYGGEPYKMEDEKFKNGYWIQPTLFGDCKKGMKIVDEEIFGPVACLFTFDTEEEAIEMANDTDYGLAAGVFSKDSDRCMRVVHALEAGTVWCNNQQILNPAVPFGGMKQSGIGRELGYEGIHEYVQTKAINWNYGEKLEWPPSGH